MAYHPDRNTMDVLIADQLRERPVAYAQREPMHNRTGFGGRHYLHTYVPELRDGEECVWTVGSDVPVIVHNAGRDDTAWATPPGYAPTGSEP